jgi:predicted ester cyclase
MSLLESKNLCPGFVEEAQHRHDLAEVDESFSPDFVDRSGMANPASREGARVLFAMHPDAFSEGPYAVRRQLAVGDRVKTHKTFQKTRLGTFGAMHAQTTGRSVTFDLIDSFTVAGGPITEHWAVSDQLLMMQELGIVPADG